MITIPGWLQWLGLILFGLVLIINVLSLLCKSKKGSTIVPKVKRYTAIGHTEVQQGERTRSLYYSNEKGNDKGMR
jgi:hypothetical protein